MSMSRCERLPHDISSVMANDGEGKWLLLIPAAILLAFAAPPFLAKTSNCGGNTAALSVCGTYASVVRISAASNSFDIAAVSDPDILNQLRRFTPYHWIPTARFLVLQGPVRIDEGAPRRIVVLCDTPFTNVPQRRFIKAPPTHAVGYSDGTTALITPVEFAKLDITSFAPLDTCIAKLDSNRGE